MLRALVIEDESALQIFYKRVLEKVNYQVSIASDGKQAILALSSVNVPHLIVLDMRLPDTNGVEVLRHIAQQEHLNDVHVVVATAGAEYEQHLSLLPKADFLLKPVRPTQIIEIAEKQAERFMA